MKNILFIGVCGLLVSSVGIGAMSMGAMQAMEAERAGKPTQTAAQTRS